MPDLIAALPASDRRLIARMAEAAAVPPEAMLLQMAREYVALVRSAPAALPSNAMRAACLRAVKVST